MERVLGLDGGDGCTNYNIFNATEHLKMIVIVYFMFCVLRTRVRGEWEMLLSNKYRVSVWEDGKVLEMDDGCTTM